MEVNVDVTASCLKTIGTAKKSHYREWAMGIHWTCVINVAYSLRFYSPTQYYSNVNIEINQIASHRFDNSKDYYILPYERRRHPPGKSTT